MSNRNLRAKDIMTTGVRTFRRDHTLAAANRELLATGHWGAPVVDVEGRLLGVISRSDVAQVVAASPLPTDRLPVEAIHELASRGALGELSGDAAKRLDRTHVGEVMQRQVVSVSPDALLTEVARTLSTRGIHRVFVVEDEKLAGVITSQDFVRLYLQLQVAEL